MNPYLLYALLIAACFPVYVPFVYFMHKNSIVLKISLLILPTVIILCYTSFAFALTRNYYLFIPAVGSLLLTLSVLSYAIKKPIQDIESNIKTLTDGDLNVELIEKWKDRKDEFGLIAINLTLMSERLGEVITSINNISKEVAEVSEQMKMSSTSVSQDASEQAASTEEITASMEQMIANIQQNVENAGQAERISINAASGITVGLESTQQSVSSMKEIAAKIGIINDISFQTNILALNAAVEAARAGDYGRGFAVVAAEVRKLAERSKVAAEEIVNLSKNGVNISEKAGTQLSEVAPEVSKTSNLVREISVANQEQHSGANQINNAIMQLNQATQRNAAASEEMATNADELATKSSLLEDSISYFKLNSITVRKKEKVLLTDKRPKLSHTFKKEVVNPKSGKNIVLSNSVDSDADFESF
jgi:methyl-accepting chemotaxis protein